MYLVNQVYKTCIKASCKLENNVKLNSKKVTCNLQEVSVKVRLKCGDYGQNHSQLSEQRSLSPPNQFFLVIQMEDRPTRLILLILSIFWNLYSNQIISKWQHNENLYKRSWTIEGKDIGKYAAVKSNTGSVYISHNKIDMFVVIVIKRSQCTRKTNDWCNIKKKNSKKRTISKACFIQGILFHPDF